MANKKTKLQPRVKIQEERAIKNKIRNGTYGRYYLAKDPGNDSKLAREQRVVGSGPRTYVVSKLTWTILSTYAALTAK